MKLSSPDADEVFFKFLERTDSKKINKTFGVAKEAITSAENVKSVEKSAFLYFTSEKRKKKLKQDKKELKAEEVSASKLKNIKFYVFKEDVDIDAWRGSDFVPMLKNLKEVRCKKCSGKGTKKCDKCNDSRSISCEDCNGKGTEKCNPCDGKGTITAELKVLEVNGKGEEKTKYEKRTYQCQKCFGSGERACKNCGGTKTIVCYECKGNSVSCRECDGVGMHYELKDGPVPLAITPGKELHSFLTKKDEWMRKDKEYQKKLESAETLSIQDSQQLNEKDLKNLFGVLELDKDLKKCIDETRKAFEELQKGYEKEKSPEKPLKPISMVLLLRLAVETPKKKKFDIYALGTKNRYALMTNRL